MKYFLLLVSVFFLITEDVNAQSDPIRGKITAENGDGLPGVNIVIKGTSQGTITDANGDYLLNAPADGVLLISSIGYLPQELPVNSRNTISLQLEVDVKQLDEVVVVGYGTTTRKDLVGSISKVNPLE